MAACGIFMMINPINVLRVYAACVIILKMTICDQSHFKSYLQGPCSATSAQLEHTLQDQAKQTLHHVIELQTAQFSPVWTVTDALHIMLRSLLVH